jgi:hypothetical protein
MLNSKDLQSVNDWRNLANDEMPDNDRALPDVSQTARHALGFPGRRSSREHTIKGLSSLAGSPEERQLAFREVDRDVGENDAA